MPPRTQVSRQAPVSLLLPTSYHVNTLYKFKALERMRAAPKRPPSRLARMGPDMIGRVDLTALSREELESRIRFELDATWTVFDNEARTLALEYARVGRQPPLPSLTCQSTFKPI